MAGGLDEVLRHLDARVPAMARTIVARYAAGSPLYRGRVPLQLQTTMASTCRMVLRLMLDALRDGHGTPDDALRLIRERARDRAAEEVPLQEYLRSLQLTFDLFWDELADALATEPAALGDALRQARAVHDAVLYAGAAGYDEHLRLAAIEHDTSGAKAVAALLAGDPGPITARFQGAVPAELTLAVAEFGPDEAVTGPDPTVRRVAGRRRVQRVLEALERAIGEPPVADLRPEGGVLLLAGPPADLTVLAGALEPAAAAPVTLAAEPLAALGDAPAAAAVARRILRIVRGTGRPPRGYRLADVALDYHLGADSPAAAELLAVVAPLRDRPDLRETLAAYFDQDLDRRRAARALGVHPNTVDNRLARVHGLTGLDVTTAAGLLTAAVATTHWRLAAGGLSR